MTERIESRPIQVFPRGTCYQVVGEFPSYRIREGYGQSELPYRKPTIDECKAIYVQELASRFLANEIYHCCSSMVHAMNETACEAAGVDYYEEVYPLLQRLDYEAAWDNSEALLVSDSCGSQNYIVPDCDVDKYKALEAEYEQDREEYNAEKDSEDDDFLDLDEYRDNWLNDNATAYDGDTDNYSDLCEAEGIDVDDYREAYEHWVVSDWLARQLAAIGEITGELFDFSIWGRTCTGQGIIMDGTLQEVAESILSDHDFDRLKAVYGEKAKV